MDRNLLELVLYYASMDRWYKDSLEVRIWSWLSHDWYHSLTCCFCHFRARCRYLRRQHVGFGPLEIAAWLCSILLRMKRHASLSNHCNLLSNDIKLFSKFVRLSEVTRVWKNARWTISKEPLKCSGKGANASWIWNFTFAGKNAFGGNNAGEISNPSIVAESGSSSDTSIAQILVSSQWSIVT